MSTRQAARIRQRNLHRSNVTYAVGVVALVAVLGWIIITLQTLSSSLHTAVADRDALAAQVRHLGATPVAGPRGAAGQDATGVPGEAGEQGLPGEPGQAGTPGSPGASGPPGASGQPGADSTVPGPAGASGAAGTAGKDGANGQDGRDGTNGADGKDGSPGPTCPTGYTLGPDPNDPDTLVCRRDDAPSPTPTTSPTASAGDTPLLPSLLAGFTG